MILSNLILGNTILYFHEIYGRHQTEVAPRLWISFSLAGISALVLSAYFIKTRKSTLFAFMLSLIVSFLIPIVGFFFSMEFSLVATFVGAAYLYYGFFNLIFPMLVLNFLFFRWIQNP